MLFESTWLTTALKKISKDVCTWITSGHSLDKHQEIGGIKSSTKSKIWDISLIYIRVGWKVHRLNSSYDDVISAVDDFFINGIQAQQYRWKKCVDHEWGRELYWKINLIWSYTMRVSWSVSELLSWSLLYLGKISF